MVRLRAACVVLSAAVAAGGAGAAANVPNLWISTTGEVRGDGDTIVIAVSSPSTRVEVDVPAGYDFPHPAPGAETGHAFIQLADASGERGMVSALQPQTSHACAPSGHDQVWDAGFTAAHVFVFLTGQKMTVCPLPSQTTAIVIASKYWSTPRAPGAYVWRATTADGTQATATIRLPVRLTLVRTRRGPRTRLTARLTENGAPVAAKVVQLVAAGRSTALARTRTDGSVAFALRIRRRTVVYAVAAIGEQTGEPHSVQSNRLVLRP
jgi:hypothetical protein